MRGMEHRGIVSVDGPVIIVKRSENSFYGEIVAVRDRFAEKRIGRVIDLSEEYAVVQIFGSTSGIDLNESTTEFLDTPMELRVGEGLLGRVFNGLGEPVDGYPHIVSSKKVRLYPNRYFVHRRHEHPYPRPKTADFFGRRLAAQPFGGADCPSGKDFERGRRICYGIRRYGY